MSRGVYWVWLPVLCSSLLFSMPAASRAGERQVLRGQVPNVIAKQNLKPVGRLPGDTILQLAIGLPLRNRQALASLLRDLYTPGSGSFRQYLTPRQFTERFGPTERDYQALIAFIKASGLAVTGTSSNRLLLDVKAPVADIERVFHVTMRTYQHPTEARTFYAPDVDPSLDLAVPVLHISGLDSFIIPHRPKLQRVDTEPAANGAPTGTGPGGTFLPQDIRNAYLPGVTLSGAGQSVGLLEYNAYYSDLIQDFVVYNGLVANNVSVENWELDGAPGTPSGTGYEEAQVDIEMAIGMAPGLDSVIVYELPSPTNSIPIPPDDALNLMAAQDLANQLSSSWEFQLSPNTDEIFQELAAQGQSFFQSSGDGGGRTGSNVYSPFDDPYITLVGGTQLTMSNNSYVSEVVFNQPDPSQSDYYSYSGGGISPNYSIPWWQEGVSMAANGGSTAQRNMPDVAMIAYEVFAFYSETAPKSGGYEGTSVAAPLWAGLMAVINEQAADDGLPAIGFANPALYAIGKSGNYNSCFHDITVGNNENPLSPGAFVAVAGYDLCTGWGTPKGQALINALCVNPVPGSMKWVKFGGSVAGDGSWESPYNTMAAAVAGVPANGAIVIKGPGSSSETLTISKAMTISTVGGAATVGH